MLGIDWLDLSIVKEGKEPEKNQEKNPRKNENEKHLPTKERIHAVFSLHSDIGDNDDTVS